MKVQAHCNSCGGSRNHEVLHSEASEWRDADLELNGTDTYQTLKCCGCDLIKLRHIEQLDGSKNQIVRYIPPAISRKPPRWLTTLWANVGAKDKFLEPLLKEIYTALQNDLPRLGAMGVRSLLEQIMISQAGDKGTFKKNLQAFVDLGHLSPRQRERLETTLEAGHAAIHRDFKPTTQQIATLLDIAENVVESVYLHDESIKALKQKIPSRPKKSEG